MASLSHFDQHGKAHMVDVGPKPETQRMAVAQGVLRLAPATLALVMAGGMAKGDVLGIARLAGIMAAKRTADLIPLCHPLPLSAVQLDLACEPDHDRITITATVKTIGRTGVEMEALTAVSVAGLTLYDMCKSVDRAMTLDHIRLCHKSGGKSGVYDAQEAVSHDPG